jgi:polyisoprenoid-binding protein YceI
MRNDWRSAAFQGLKHRGGAMSLYNYSECMSRDHFRIGIIGRIVFGVLVSSTLSHVALAQTHAKAASAGVPVYKITPVVSKVDFGVKASVSIEGTFDKWNATLTFKAPDVSTGVLDVQIQADSVNTGSGFKDDELRSEKFFNVKSDPYITFRSSKMVQTGPHTFDVQGTFTIRGVSKPETLTFEDDPEGKGTGELKGTMAFDRKEFGMNSGIPFIRIADRVEVTVDFKATRVSGPPLLFK